MNVKRIAAFGVSGAVLAAMIAGATTSGTRRATPPPVVNTSTVELKGAELAAEIARLRERLRPVVEPQQPARNLFQFGRRPAAAVNIAPTPPAVETVVVPPAAAAPPPPSLTLVGMAVDGSVRTAIISGFGDLFLVKEGETLAGQYRVAKIGADGVDLTSLADGATLHLTLK
jgi:hypothetical protein